MIHLLLVIIYLAFISMGLPDSLLGSAWPVMYQEFGTPVSYAGIISMIIAAGTIISSLQNSRLSVWLGTGKVTAASVTITAVALIGFSCSHSFASLCLWAVPYGLGAGCVDASLNNYIALHYASRHMNWLHCMWGIGASAVPNERTLHSISVYIPYLNFLFISKSPYHLSTVLISFVLIYNFLHSITILC